MSSESHESSNCLTDSYGLDTPNISFSTSEIKSKGLNLVNASQKLIAEFFPCSNGFQKTIHGQTMSYDIKKSEFVQVMHTGYGHWVTVFIYGCDPGIVDILDSLTPAITSSLEEQIAAAIVCLPSSVKEIKIRFVYIIVVTLS